MKKVKNETKVSDSAEKELRIYAVMCRFLFLIAIPLLVVNIIFFQLRCFYHIGY